MEENNKVEEEAKKWVRDNIDFLIDNFASLKNFPSVKNPFSMFMAGSPGAGKTEFSKSLIKTYPDQNTKIVRIDADEIRNLIPQYEGCNAYRVQGAAGLGVTKLYDHVQKYDQNVIVDGTFSDYKIAFKNVERALKHNRKVGIFYIYQDPIVAWEFTKKREEVEGRRVSKEMFIESFFKAKENANKIKEVMGDKVMLYLVEKDYTNNLKKPYFNINKIDDFLKIEYTTESLERDLK